MKDINLFIQKILKKSLSQNKNKRKILFTVDDGLLSFYENAWPILKKKKFPLFYL